MSGLPPSQTPAISLPLSDNDLNVAENAAVDPKHDFAAYFDQYGYLGVIDIAHLVAKDGGHTLGKYDLVTWAQACIPLLSSLPKESLKAMYTAGLSPSIAGNNKLSDLYHSESSAWRNLRHDPFAPCIYVRELVDGQNNSPTANQLSAVVEALRGYMSGDDRLASQNSHIERQSNDKRGGPDAMKEGRLYFLQGPEGRAAKLWTFCAALEKRLSAIDEDARGLPTPFTLKYVGCSKPLATQETNHERDQTQWLCRLVRNTCMMLFPDSRFGLETNVVAYCCSADECHFGKEIFTRSTHAYHDTGLGFCVEAAGASVGSFNWGSASHGSVVAFWADTDNFRTNIMPYFGENLEWQRSKIAAYNVFVVRRKVEMAANVSATAGRKRKREFVAGLDASDAKSSAELEALDQTLQRIRRKRNDDAGRGSRIDTDE
jgi:hypothetical protein